MKMDRIKAALAAILAEDNFGTMTTDKGIIKWEGEENLKEGDTVVMVDEDGNDKTIEDGEYVTDEVKITVENGSVKSIEEIKKEEETPEEATSEEEETTTEGAFMGKKSAYEASYSEKERKIMDAIIAAGYKDAWIVDAGDDFAVVELYHEVDGVWVDEYLRFDIEWDGEDAKVVGEPTKVRNAFVPEDTNTEEMFEAETSGETTEETVEETNEEGTAEDTDKMEERLKAIEDRLDKIEEALKNVETAPVEEQYEVANKETATSRKEKRLNEIFGRC